MSAFPEIAQQAWGTTPLSLGDSPRKQQAEVFVNAELDIIHG